VRRHLRGEGGSKVFFSEEKKQKTFIPWGLVLQAGGACPVEGFVAFLQKRNACRPALSPRRRR
jgi:hypothetical protein